MDVLSVLNPSKGVEAEVTVGKKEESVNAQVGDVNNTSTSAEQVGDRVENQAVTNYVQNIPMDYLWLLILAVMLPNPAAIWKGITNGLKSLGNGLLILLGRRKA